ncbi:hypothetical protein M2451_000051 [Dysgonomonas sp. PFB1-18]|uniref:carboxypeptidase-like regulatory domain-containing protein n=1 Tax=unclassified Dysgonomonas TaxID=2630389 RepID=UPI0024732408|nr:MULTISPECIES: carboxypeptidase-like regulatory domain-containing protein [unclassified Dysgonomonas]MDH6307601.1 hypothetical protein [Dysgonomonas sp. PF1-14]MDH6337519.1 hypothetical protein [Dysgonomonas sp. PF1-16]MDH6378744.1 hypothetical protein [Dysgonomonas sp. PFB1-18]MDH6399162.1 hypothetical protein [Dysgonomonas sp. PF1-23]
MKKYLFLLLILLPYAGQAQTIISGVVKDETNKPVSEVNITIHEKGNKLMSGYVMTDNAGKYRLEYKGKSDSIIVAVSGFNVKKQSRVIANCSQDINFVIEMESIVLNEVKIKPPKIRQAGDTLNYLVESFSDINDRTIGDVLKKMPGIEVKDDGAILYQDKPINKFYIENADLLQGRYGIATNNIEAKDVATVQVLENHQPIKALKDRGFSEEAAINLKLKDSAKGTIIANAQVGAGASPLLWNNELTAMYITKKLQNITTYKGNNSGDDTGREQSSFYSNDMSQKSNKALLNIQSPSTPAISEKRYLDNQVNTVSLNNLWSLKKDYQLTANLNYLNDLQRRDSYALTEYYLAEENNLRIEEQLNSRLRKEKLNADIQLNANKTKYYFNNSLKLAGTWDRERGDAFSGDNVFQSLKKPDYSINNTFDMVKTKNKHTWTIYSFNGYNTISQTLSVQPLLHTQLFDSAQGSETMIQDVESESFSSYNKVSLGLGEKSLRQDYELSFRADIQRLKSKLHTGVLFDTADSLRNNLRQNKFEWIFKPVYSYAKGTKLNVSLSLPLSYIILSKNNKIAKDADDNTYFYINPSFFANYKISPFWETSLNYRYNNSMGSINDAYTGYIMSSYRNLLRNDGKLFKQQAQNAGLRLSYRNPLTTLFGTVYVDYFHNRANLLYDYYYQDILKVQSTIDMPNTTKGLNVYLSISKDIESLRSKVFLNGSYKNSQSSQINQGKVIDYSNQGFSLSPRIITNLGSVASVQYQFRYSQNESKIKTGGEKFKPIRSTSQDVQLNIFPTKSLIINLRYEHFYNNAIVSGSRSISFGDIRVKYKWKKVELMLDYTNVFNVKQFVSAFYNDVSRYYSSYDLRPAEVMLKARFKLK